MLSVEDCDTPWPGSASWIASATRWSAGVASPRLTSALEWCNVSVATKTSRDLSTIVSWTDVVLFETDVTLSCSPCDKTPVDADQLIHLHCLCLLASRGPVGQTALAVRAGGRKSPSESYERLVVTVEWAHAAGHDCRSTCRHGDSMQSKYR